MRNDFFLTFSRGWPFYGPMASADFKNITRPQILDVITHWAPLKPMCIQFCHNHSLLVGHGARTSGFLSCSAQEPTNCLLRIFMTMRFGTSQIIHHHHFIHWSSYINLLDRIFPNGTRIFSFRHVFLPISNFWVPIMLFWTWNIPFWTDKNFFIPIIVGPCIAWTLDHY